jgi:hypothetical protein
MCASKLYVDTCHCIDVYSPEPFMYKGKEYTDGHPICDTTDGEYEQVSETESLFEQILY